MSEENVNCFTKEFRGVGLGSSAILVDNPTAPSGGAVTTSAPSARRLTFAGAPPISCESNVASASLFTNVFRGGF